MGATTAMLEPDAMYQAFANGVSPKAFTSTPKLPLKTDLVPIAPPIIVNPEIGSFERSINEILEPNLIPPPVANIPDSYQHQRSVNVWLICAVVGIAAWAVFAALSTSSSTENLSSSDEPTSLSTVTPVDVPKPLTDEQKLTKAKLAFAAWKGEEDIYDDSSLLLQDIPKGSVSYSAAQNLIERWSERKRKSDLHKEREEHLEAKRQKIADRQAAIAEIKQEKEDATYFTGDGDVKVAIGNVKLHRSTSEHVANSGSTFVYVYVDVKNAGSSTIHANPNDFTLADQNGNTASHDSDTYSLSNYFDAVNLSPGQETGGWLIFCMRKDRKYTLTRTGGFDGSDVVKPVIP